MPELPEVETIARQLDGVLHEKKIREVRVLREKSFQGDENKLVGRKIKKVSRVAKMILIEFFDRSDVVVVHLKMTGQLIWRPFISAHAASNKNEYHGRQVVGGHPSRDWVEELPSSHTRVVLVFDDQSRLFFNDMRVFGWMRMVTRAQWLEIKNKLPPDVVNHDFSTEYFAAVLRNSGRAVKQVMMDSGKIGGAGNIYANDALNLAKIDPRKMAKSLSEKEVEKLHKAVKTVINLGIKYGGATYSDFRDTEGLGGRYQDHFLVYKRDGESCKNCGEVIKKIKLGGRGTYYCPSCQI